MVLTTNVSSMQMDICAPPYLIFPFWLGQVSCRSSAAHQASDGADGVRSSHGPHNNVYGPSGDSLCSSAGPDPGHKHFSATAAAAATATAAAAAAAGASGTAAAAAADHSHAARAGSPDSAADKVPTGERDL